MVALLVAASFLTAAFTDPPLVSAEGEPLLRPAPIETRGVVLSAAVDLGVPDGLALTVFLCPRQWLRLGGGVMTHLGGIGVRGSVVFSPIPGPMRPVLQLDYGHYLTGSLSWLLNSAASDAAKSVLGSIQYDFGNFHLGLEIGDGRFAFSFRAGVSYLVGSVGAFEQALGSAEVTGTRPQITALFPSGKLGLAWSFF